MRFLNRFKLFLGIIIPIFGFFLMSQNTFAATMSPHEFGLRWRDYGSSTYNWQLGLYAGPNYYVSGFGLNAFRIQWQDLVYQGNHASIHSEINVVSWDIGNIRRNQWVNLPYQTVLVCASSVGTVKVAQSNVNTVITNWWGNDNSARSTLTFYVDIAFSGLPQNSTGHLSCLIGSDSYAFASNNTVTNTRYYVEQAPSTIEFSNNINDALLQTQINQNNSIIEQNNAYYNHEYEAENNISSQTTGNIPNSSDQQTTNLIGLLSSFLSQLQAFSATNCNLALPFPEFIGGTQTVNICQGKDVLGNFITIIGTLTMVMFYIPLAVVLLKMIYNEIRSFTNG